MTRRARMLLDALEDGCQTRHQIFAHQGRFTLLNNAAAELRAAGIDVVWVAADESYVLLDERDDAASRRSPVPLVEETSGQMAMVA